MCYDNAMRRGEFENLLRQALDDELVRRGFRLTPQPPADFDDEKPAAVYEADPDEFGQRYPPLDGRAGGNVRCVDLWVYLDQSTGRITSDLDGASLDTLMARFGVPDRTQPGKFPVDTSSQLSRLSWQIAAILDAAERG